MAKLSMMAREEVLRKYMAGYRKASKKEKGRILGIVCESTGLSRDRAARLLAAHAKGKKPPRPPGKRGRKRIYGFEACKALKEIRAYMDLACG